MQRNEHLTKEGKKKKENNGISWKFQLALSQRRTCDYNLTQSYFYLFSHFSRIQSGGISILLSCEVESVNLPLSVKTDIFHFLPDIVV